MIIPSIKFLQQQIIKLKVDTLEVHEEKKLGGIFLHMTQVMQRVCAGSYSKEA